MKKIVILYNDILANMPLILKGDRRDYVNKETIRRLQRHSNKPVVVQIQNLPPPKRAQSRQNNAKSNTVVKIQIQHK